MASWGSNQGFWLALPDRLKDSYHLYKLKQHDHQPCAYSYRIDAVLSHSQISKIPGFAPDRGEVLKKIAALRLWSGYFHHDEFSPESFQLNLSSHQRRRNRWKQSSWYRPQDDFISLMLSSAVRRNDCGDLRLLLEAGANPARWCEFFCLIPLYQIARTGSKEIATALLSCESWWIAPGAFRDLSRAFGAAVSIRNKEAIIAWSEVLSKNSVDWACRVQASGVIRAAHHGSSDIIDIILQFYTGHRPRLLYEALIEAIKYGQIPTVEHILDLGGFDMNNLKTPRCLKGPLFVALHDCPYRTRTMMIKLLLGRAADPNKTYEKVRGTLLQGVFAAGVKQRTEIITMLLEHGADPNIIRPRHRNCFGPPLHLAAKMNNSGKWISLLLKHGANPKYVWKGTTLLRLCRREPGVYSEGVQALLENGWDMSALDEWCTKELGRKKLHRLLYLTVTKQERPGFRWPGS
jgi:hypothetical protein